MMNEGRKELSREEIRQIAEETLKALGVEPVELDDGEQEIIERLAKNWLNRKKDE